MSYVKHGSNVADSGQVMWFGCCGDSGEEAAVERRGGNIVGDGGIVIRLRSDDRRRGRLDEVLQPEMNEELD